MIDNDIDQVQKKGRLFSIIILFIGLKTPQRKCFKIITLTERNVTTSKIAGVQALFVISTATRERFTQGMEFVPCGNLVWCQLIT